MATYQQAADNVRRFRAERHEAQRRFIDDHRDLISPWLNEPPFVPAAIGRRIRVQAEFTRLVRAWNSCSARLEAERARQE